MVEELTKDHLDIALAYRIPDTFDVTVVAQNYVTPCLLVPISHPFAKRRFVDVCECADLELAVPDETLTIRESYVRMFEKARIRPKVTLVTNSFELMRTAATVGLLLGNRQPVLWRHDRAAGPPLCAFTRRRSGEMVGQPFLFTAGEACQLRPRRFLEQNEGGDGRS